MSEASWDFAREGSASREPSVAGTWDVVDVGHERTSAVGGDGGGGVWGGGGGEGAAVLDAHTTSPFESDVANLAELDDFEVLHLPDVASDAGGHGNGPAATCGDDDSLGSWQSAAGSSTGGFVQLNLGSASLPPRSGPRAASSVIR